MQPISREAIVPLLLGQVPSPIPESQKPAFFEAIEIVIGVFHDFIAKSSRRVIIDSYIAFQRDLETRLNAEYRVKLSTLEGRDMLDLEDELLHAEMRYRFPALMDYGLLFLKIDETTFTPDRFIEVLLNGFSVNDATERERLRTQLLNTTEDFELICENYTRECKFGAGSRSLYGDFAEKVFCYAKTKEGEIRHKYCIPDGPILSYKPQIQEMAKEDREFLIRQFFTNAYTYMMYVSNTGTIRKIKGMIDEGMEDFFSPSVIPVDGQLELLESIRKKVSTVLSHNVEITLPQNAADRIEDINALAVGALREVGVVAENLQNLICLLEAEQEVKKVVPITAPSPRSPGFISSIFRSSSPRGESPRKDKRLGSPRLYGLAKSGSVAQDEASYERYIAVFKKALELIQQILQAKL